jgi:hypothetical protein
VRKHPIRCALAVTRKRGRATTGICGVSFLSFSRVLIPCDSCPVFRAWRTTLARGHVSVERSARIALFS